MREGLVPGGVLANVKKEREEGSEKAKDDSAQTERPAEGEEEQTDEQPEDGAEPEDPENSEDDWVVLPTMSLRIHWHLIPDPPSPKKKSNKKKRARGKAEEESDDDDASDAEEENNKKRKKGKIVHVSAGKNIVHSVFI